MIYLIATITTASARAHALLTERHHRLADDRDAGDALQTGIIAALLGAAALAIVAIIVAAVNRYGSRIGGL